MSGVLVATFMGEGKTWGDEAKVPFTFADFTWLTGNSRQKDFPLDGKVFSGQFQVDTNYVYSFANPRDHVLTGSTNAGRTNEVQVMQLGIGGDVHHEGMRGRFMTQFGMYATMTPRNDASPSRGQWQLDNAYRYISEAYGGYHWDEMFGINVDVGIFMSYVGLESYYNFENWMYQMSYVSNNTPWFFNGVRVQIFLSENLKIEPWIVNGFQAYGMYNEAPGVGFQVLWRPTGDWSFLSNEYYGRDTLNNPDRVRFLSDNSIQCRYLDQPGAFLSKAALSFTGDVGLESGGGVNGFDNSSGTAQYFLGFMVYNRFWFEKDKYAVTFGGGAINNPGRFLAILPPVNGATAATGTPYFTQNPGDQLHMWDASVTFDYMPSQFVTFRFEFIHREADTGYFAGPGGVTPPGGNTGTPATPVAGWSPDLSNTENRFNVAMMVRL